MRGASVDVASLAVLVKADVFTALEVVATEDDFDTAVVFAGVVVGTVSEEEGDHIAAG